MSSINFHKNGCTQVQTVHASKYRQCCPDMERMSNTWGPFYSQINTRAAMDSMNAKWHILSLKV
jgi:hypothetical protein